MTNSIIMETPRLKAVEMAAPSTPSSGKAEAAEDEGVVADDIGDIDLRR